MAGAEGNEAQLCALWEAEEEERVGEAVRDEGLERRPLERKAARPCEAPSGRINFSLSSRLVRPRAGGGGERQSQGSAGSQSVRWQYMLSSRESELGVSLLQVSAEEKG